MGSKSIHQAHKDAEVLVEKQEESRAQKAEAFLHPEGYNSLKHVQANTDVAQIFEVTLYTIHTGAEAPQQREGPRGGSSPDASRTSHPVIKKNKCWIDARLIFCSLEKKIIRFNSKHKSIKLLFKFHPPFSSHRASWRYVIPLFCMTRL